MIHLGISVTFVQSGTVAGVFLLVLVLRLPGLCRDSWVGVVSLVGSILISFFLAVIFYVTLNNVFGVNPRFEKKM
jgi:hypothetical protein